ncbi:MAG TPA: hypothetical protein PKW55_02965 [Spirochaetota bacterium]|nr:hypothetical protein [Spirochaetota bacterium]HOM38189.1 hypothetical protein [Spirochaetota bacterium]HPQ48593.1 hypothetical protein [Spirochaetota bacterium]
MEEKIKRFYEKERIDQISPIFKEKVMNSIYNLVEKESKKKENSFVFKLVLSLSFIVLLVIIYMSGIFMKDESTVRDIIYFGKKDKKVKVVGDFNKWQPQDMYYDGEKWVLKIEVKNAYMQNYLILSDNEEEGNEKIEKNINEIKMIDYFGKENIVFISN